MAFTPEQKKAWRQRPEVRQHERAYKAEWLATPTGRAYAARQPAKQAALARTPEYKAKLEARLAPLREAKRTAKREKQARERPLKQHKQREHERRYRAELRSKAISVMGGACEWCGYNESLALQFDHIKPVRRGRNGIARNRANSDDTYRDVIAGRAENIQLLCANCHVIKTKLIDDLDGQHHLNLVHLEPREPAPLPLFDGVPS